MSNASHVSEVVRKVSKLETDRQYNKNKRNHSFQLKRSSLQGASLNALLRIVLLAQIVEEFVPEHAKENLLEACSRRERNMEPDSDDDEGSSESESDSDVEISTLLNL